MNETTFQRAKKLSEQRLHYNELINQNVNVTEQFVAYWKLYSSFNTWHFWFILFIIIALLVALFFLIDRQHVFIVGFFGFATHMIFVYFDIIMTRNGLLGYPYHLIPYIPSFALSATVVPITIMLVFQWTYKNNKNFYLYAFITTLFLAFIFKPTITLLGYFVIHELANYFMLFLMYMIMFTQADWLTKVYLWLNQQYKETEDTKMPRRDRYTYRETTPNPYGFKEGVVNEPTGVQYGVEVSKERVINPADIAKMTSKKSDRDKKN